MDNHGRSEARMWFMATVLAGFISACGSGDDGKIFGTGGGTGNSGAGNPGAGGPLALDLRSAATFGIASQGGMTSTGVTVVNGDVALSPLGTCTDATGVGPAPGSAVPPPGCAVQAYGAHPTGMTVNGSVRFPTDSDVGVTAAGVMTDLNLAWNEGLAKPNTQPAIPASELGGKTFVPGVYENANLGLMAGGLVQLDAQGDANAVFIFKTTAPGGDFSDSGTLLLPSEIRLINGAQARNVWFVIGRDATIGSGTKWNGNILAGRTLTINHSSTVNGRALSGAAGGGAGSLTLTGANLPFVGGTSAITISVP